jgi:uncharacterized protein (DUF1684 family)
MRERRSKGLVPSRRGPNAERRFIGPILVVALAVCALAIGAARPPDSTSTGAPKSAPAGVGTPDRSTRTEDLAEYIASVLEHRSHRDAFFAKGKDSPVPAGEKASWPPLQYFPVDPSWRLTLRFFPEPKPRDLTLPSSAGENRHYWRLGRVTIEREGMRHDLFAYRAADSKRGETSLWIPFVDAEAGRETYPAGRYLDADLLPDGTVLVDFNLAYNPYCAYGWSRYSCPLTPRENRLPFAVKAGERGYHR